MFIGHYAVALALKRVEKRASLGFLFLAVQWADILYFPLVGLGVEKLNIVPHFTKANHLDLEYFPYSHGLLASTIWAALTYVGVGLLTKNTRIAIIMSVAVLSHWFLDLIVHIPDLPLWSDASPKLGLGLWNYPLAAYWVEAAMMTVGVWWYLGGTNPKTSGGKFGIIIFALMLLIFNAINFFSPPPPDNKVMLALSSTVIFALIGTVAFWLDKKRE